MYKDDIKRFAKDEERTGNPNTNNKNMQSGLRNVILHWKMCHVENKKCETRHNGNNRTAKSGKHQYTWRKGKLQVLGNIENGHYQRSRDERKHNKIVPQMNEKTSWNQTIQ